MKGCVEIGGVEVVMTGANVYSAFAEGTQSYSAARKRRAAFEANVAANLDQTMPDDGIRRVALLRALGAAHVRIRHGIEARTTFALGKGRYYVVFQAGLARRQRNIGAPHAGPLAERVMARIDREMLDDLTEDERNRVAKAIDLAEITRPHPVDVRAVVPAPGVRAYLNFIAGKDKRGDALNAADNRRAPANETLGFVMFIVMVCGVTLLGVSLLASTIINALEIAADPEGRTALWRMASSLLGLGSKG